MYLIVQFYDGISNFMMELLLPPFSHRNFLLEFENLFSVLLDLQCCVLTSTLDWCVVLEASLKRMQNRWRIKTLLHGYLILYRNLSSRISQYMASMKLHTFCEIGKYLSHYKSRKLRQFNMAKVIHIHTNTALKSLWIFEGLWLWIETGICILFRCFIVFWEL